jgi:hypothetical protein
MPVDEKTHLDQAWRDTFLSTLLGRPPDCVLHLLADAVVPLLDPKTPSFTGGGGQLGTKFGLEGSKNMEGVPIDLCDKAQVDTRKGKLYNVTSDETIVGRKLSSRLLDDRSTSVYLVSKPHRVLVTRSLPFSVISLSGLLFSVVHPVDRIPSLVKTCKSIGMPLSQGYVYQPSWKEHHLSFQT